MIRIEPFDNALFPGRAWRDLNTEARQQWLRELQESRDDERAAMGMLTGAIAWGAVIVLGIAIGAVYADWMTGEQLTADILIALRGRL